MIERVGILLMIGVVALGMKVARSQIAILVAIVVVTVGYAKAYPAGGGVLDGRGSVSSLACSSCAALCCTITCS